MIYKYDIMKFELDHRTGMMVPKKDENIYFARSIGGGLIVDDKKNRKKFIIERDGKVTVLFGSMSKDNLHFYDMRDAKQIENRVMRMFGYIQGSSMNIVRNIFLKYWICAMSWLMELINAVSEIRRLLSEVRETREL